MGPGLCTSSGTGRASFSPESIFRRMSNCDARSARVRFFTPPAFMELKPPGSFLRPSLAIPIKEPPTRPAPAPPSVNNFVAAEPGLSAAPPSPRWPELRIANLDGCAKTLRPPGSAGPAGGPTPPWLRSTAGVCIQAGASGCVTGGKGAAAGRSEEGWVVAEAVPVAGPERRDRAPVMRAGAEPRRGGAEAAGSGLCAGGVAKMDSALMACRCSLRALSCAEASPNVISDACSMSAGFSGRSLTASGSPRDSRIWSLAFSAFLAALLPRDPKVKTYYPQRLRVHPSKSYIPWCPKYCCTPYPLYVSFLCGLCI